MDTNKVKLLLPIEFYLYFTGKEVDSKEIEKIKVWKKRKNKYHVFNGAMEYDFRYDEVWETRWHDARLDFGESKRFCSVFVFDLKE